MTIYVGDYYLGHERVSLFVDSEMSGGYFSLFANDTANKLHPKDTRHGRIVIGFLDCKHWRDVMEILDHEVYEYALTRIGCRLRPGDPDNLDHAGYTFISTHAQFTQVVQMASWFLCPALPDLSDVWRKHERRQKKRRKKIRKKSLTTLPAIA